MPREYWGLARALPREAKASGDEVARRIKQINALINNTLDRTFNAKLSPHTMKTVLRLWAAVPRDFLIKQWDLSRERTLDIGGIWLNTGTTSFFDWETGQTELSFMPTIFHISTVRKGDFTIMERDAIIPMNISHHAVGRWFERTRSRDRQRLFNDIFALFNDPGAEPPWKCPSGEWRGQINKVEQTYGSDDDIRVQRSWSIRTFWE